MTQFEQLDLLLNEYGGIIQTFQVIDCLLYTSDAADE